jgi:ribosomal protein S18 acetylase RimI-like enzyme
MVHPLYRRHGYAQEILAFVEKRGYSSIRLLTRNTNTYSVNLYTKLGYRVVKSQRKGDEIMQTCEKILKG